jgi:hypothetical protein
MKYLVLRKLVGFRPKFSSRFENIDTGCWMSTKKVREILGDDLPKFPGDYRETAEVGVFYPTPEEVEYRKYGACSLSRFGEKAAREVLDRQAPAGWNMSD